jgi:hypothetical protein
VNIYKDLFDYLNNNNIYNVQIQCNNMSDTSLTSSINSENTTTGKGKRVLRFLILIAIFGAIYWFANAFGLAKSGFTDSAVLSTYNFYLNSAFAFLLTLIPLFFIELIITYKDSTYGNGIGFTDQGEYPSLKFFKKFSTFQLFLLSMIVFLIIGLLVFKGSSKQIIFGDINPLPKEQFTAVGSVIWGNLIVPLSENLGLAVYLALLLTVLRVVAKKYNMSQGNFVTLVYMLGIIGSGLYGLFVHLMHYGGQESSLFVVIVFWMIMGTLTLITGSFIPAWNMHGDNNLLGDLASFVTSKDLIFYVMIGIVILLIGLYLWLYVFRKNKQKTNINWMKNR